jgi:hypothetical protein
MGEAARPTDATRRPRVWRIDVGVILSAHRSGSAMKPDGPVKAQSRNGARIRRDITLLCKILLRKAGKKNRIAKDIALCQ